MTASRKAALELQRCLKECPGASWTVRRPEVGAGFEKVFEEPVKGIVLGAVGRGGLVDTLVSTAGIEDDLARAKRPVTSSRMCALGRAISC